MSADLDKAIDRAVRDMLDVEPPADLRAKVIARIGERPASSFQLSAFSFQRFAVLVGAAALLVVAMLLARRSDSPVQPPAQARAGVDEVLPAPKALEPIVPERTAPAAQARVARPAAPAIFAASTDAAETVGAEVDPLKTIAPIEVAPIAQSSITPEPIGVRPLNPIPEMQIAPLNPPDRRD